MVDENGRHYSKPPLGKSKILEEFKRDKKRWVQDLIDHVNHGLQAGFLVYPWQSDNDEYSVLQCISLLKGFSEDRSGIPL
jgi:hypothetical protein